MHVGMALEPAIVLGFVSIKIVENDVNFLFLAVGVDDAVREIQELPAPPPFVVTRPVAISRAAKSVVVPCLSYS